MGDRRSLPNILAVSGLAVFMLSIILLCLLQYTIPNYYYSRFGSSCKSIDLYKQQMPFLKQLVRQGSEGFVLWFRILLCSTWLGYITALYAIKNSNLIQHRHILILFGIISAILLIFWPTSLSCDIYGYIGYAKTYVIYGKNPYLTSPRVLLDYKDPVSQYIQWNIPSPYASVWTQLCILVAFMLRSVGLWWQVTGMKIIQAVSLIFAAKIVSDMAESQTKGYEKAVFLAIALNPLLLIEGPASGHNDILMISLLMAAFMFWEKKRITASALMLGLSAGIKFIPLAVIPWFLICNINGLSFRKAVKNAIMIALVLLPIILCYLPVWHGAATFNGLKEHYMYGPGNGASSHYIFENCVVKKIGPTIVKDQAHNTSNYWLFILGYIIISTLVFIHKNDKFTCLIAWVAFSFCMILTSKVIFPWYIAWALIPSFIYLHKKYTMVPLALLVLSFVSTLAYTI